MRKNTMAAMPMITNDNCQPSAALPWPSIFDIGSRNCETIMPAAKAPMNLIDDSDVRSFESDEITPNIAV